MNFLALRNEGLDRVDVTNSLFVTTCFGSGFTDLPKPFSGAEFRAGSIFEV